MVKIIKKLAEREIVKGGTNRKCGFWEQLADLLNQPNR